MHGEGPEGSPGAGGCPGRAGKGREGSRVLSNAATDVLHEGPEAQGGGLGTRRLAAGEGLPGGRHERLGEGFACFPRLHELVSEILGEPPYYSPGTFRVLCFGGAPVLAGGRFPAGGTRPFACQFEFPSSFCCMRRRELSRAAIPVTARSRLSPTRP